MASHVCGCFVPQLYSGRKYLPQLDLKTHVTIQATAYKAVLTQTFANPLTHDAIEQLRYTFPLYDGVSVVDFECRIGERIIRGLVQERQEAKASYDAAVKRGETAGLLEQLPEASDVFTTTLANIPPKSAIHVTISYVGELKHDAEVDGLRFTLPTTIAPRYGSYPSEMLEDASTPPISSKDAGMEIIVDVDMASALPIQKITSPSHPISVSIGTRSTAPDADASLSQGSATLALDKTGLDKDFVLQILVKEIGKPQALLETHPTLPDQRALMATFVPKFALKPARPEIIFIVDRSGSMHENIAVLVSALRVFVKSLPPGTRFNICSFGSRAELLWKKSQKYDADTMNKAIAHIESFTANFGGTETLRAITTAVDSRMGDLPTELMLLTDGDIWDQSSLFDYLNDQVLKSKGDIRLFTLGIGGGVSHALIEGAARAGNGFSQTVGDGERLDGKVVRMLRGALSPHISDCSFEVKYQPDNGFEMIEKADDAPQIDEPPAESALPGAPISLFDPHANVDATPFETSNHSSKDGKKNDHLPALDPPNVLQAPFKLPSMFAFSRTTVFLLLAPCSRDKLPESVIFRGSSPQGPLELTIPVTTAQSGATIHQLAARKAVLDLEEGRGWLLDATNPAGKVFKDTSPSLYEDLVEREAVRIGTRFQVASKWCSFVAVETNGLSHVSPPSGYSEVADRAVSFAKPSYGTSVAGVSFGRGGGGPPGGQSVMRLQSMAPSACLSAPIPPPPPAPAPAPAAVPFSRMMPSVFFAPRQDAMCDVPDAEVDSARCATPPAPKMKKKKASILGGALFGGRSRHTPAASTYEASSESLLDRIILAQSFDGFWEQSSVPWSELSLDAASIMKLGDGKHRNDLLVTAVIVLYLQEKMPGERDTWELVVEKAKDWIDGLKSLDRREGDVDIWKTARDLMEGSLM